MHFQSGVLLIRVAQEVRHDGLVVGDVGAQRYGNGLAKPVFWDGYSTFAVVMLRRSERVQPAQQPHDPQQHGARGGPGRRHSCGGGGREGKTLIQVGRLENDRKAKKIFVNYSNTFLIVRVIRVESAAIVFLVFLRR